jgi:transcriptional regulator with XRE-family HTH domain
VDVPDPAGSTARPLTPASGCGSSPGPDEAEPLRHHRLLSWSFPSSFAGFAFHSLSGKGYGGKQDWPGYLLSADLGPLFAEGMPISRRDADHMPNDADRTGTPAGVFGAELRYYRTQAGLSQKDLAALVHVSNDVISKIETGERPPAEDFPPRLDALPELDTRGELTRLWGHLKKGHKQRTYGWFERWADVEAEAKTLRSYEPLVVPGLLQTEDYARVILSMRPGGDQDDLDVQVAARLARQAVLERAKLWCVLDEGVLHRNIGGSKVMQPQLHRLAELAEHPKIAIQVIPGIDAHAGLLGGFVIAERDGKPSMAYLETAAEGQVTDSPATVADVALSFDTLRAEALPWGASRDLIRKVAEEKWT